jgi:hypothetical protein
MPDQGGSMADRPKTGKDERIREHYDQRRPQDEPMPEFEEETRREESERVIEAAEEGSDGAQERGR